MLPEGIPLDVSLGSWQGFWRLLGSEPPTADCYQQLIDLYRESHRFYHTLAHLVECFTHLAAVNLPSDLTALVALALWYHDAIYDPHRSDNEHCSAKLFERTARQQNLAEKTTQQIVAMILATAHNAIPTTSETQLLVDIDLAILGAEAIRFTEYEAQVRQEYSWVSDAMFRQGRQSILKQFLSRSAIYSTHYFFQHFERQARQNIERSPWTVISKFPISSMSRI
jgi:predicted metal-dependent HD superfamily phosphohydrolase